jgi:hypothetical protein
LQKGVNGISSVRVRDSLFYDWKKRLRESEAVTFVEVKVKDPGEQRKPAPEYSPE